MLTIVPVKEEHAELIEPTIEDKIEALESEIDKLIFGGGKEAIHRAMTNQTINSNVVRDEIKKIPSGTSSMKQNLLQYISCKLVDDEPSRRRLTHKENEIIRKATYKSDNYVTKDGHGNKLVGAWWPIMEACEELGISFFRAMKIVRGYVYNRKLVLKNLGLDDE